MTKTEINPDRSLRMQREAFVAAAKRVVDYELTRCSSGNLSCRIDADHLLVSCSGSWMADMTIDQTVLCRIENGASVEKDKRPSIEVGFHRRILQRRPDVEVVLHFQSEAATVFACRSGALPNFDITPEGPYCIGPVGDVPYLNPGSEELALAVAGAMDRHDMIIMRNHGQVTVGKDFNDALQRAAFFEFTCRLLLAGGNRISTLPQESIRYLKNLRAGCESRGV